jgi:hypothetical protein
MFIRTCSPHHVAYGGGRLLLINNDNRLLSSHSLLQIHAHARLSLRNNNVKRSSQSQS